MLTLSVDSLADKVPHKYRGSVALALVIFGAACLQFSTSLVSPLLDTASPFGVSGTRMLCAALVLALFTRPNPFALQKSDWPQVLVYGLVVSGMTLGYFNALVHLPLGIVVTVEYLGAFGVSLLGVRQWRDGLLSIGALLGVVLIAGPTFTAGNFAGYLWAVLGALCMAGYTLFSARLGTGSPAVGGLKGLSLSLFVSALVMLPWSVPAMPSYDADAWLRIIAAGSLGVALTYSVDAVAGRLTSAAVIGVLFSLDPVMGALIGLIFMGELLPLAAYAGILLIVVSGAVLVWKTNRSAISISTNTSVLQAVVSTKTGQIPILKAQKDS